MTMRANPLGPANGFWIVLVKIEVQQRESLELVGDGNIHDALGDLEGADRDQEIFEHELRVVADALLAEGNLAIRLTKPQWNFAFAIDAKTNVGVRGSKALETRF